MSAPDAGGAFAKRYKRDGPMRQRAVVIAVVVVATAGLSGCGSGTVSAADLASKAKSSLNRVLATRGVSLKSVHCPHDLDAKVGASEICTGAGSDGRNHQIRATVTSAASNTHVNFVILR